MKIYLITAILFCLPGIKVAQAQNINTGSFDSQDNGAQPLNKEAQSIWKQDTLTGDWGGTRDKLEKSGVTFSANYTGDVQSNVHGGLRGPTGTVTNGVGYAGLLNVGLALDTEKLKWWDGGKFFTNTYWTHGPSLTGKYVGDFSTLSSIDAYDTLQLYEAWYEHSLAEDRVSLRVGQLVVDEEFATSELGATFLNATFGYPTSISAYDGHPQFARAGLGGRVLIEPKLEKIPGLYFQAGVYEGNPDGATNSSGSPLNTTGLRYDMQFGVMGAFELGYHLDDEHGWKGLPGVYKVGGYLHTDGKERPPLPYLDGSGQMEEDNNIVYVMGEQMVWQECECDSKGGECSCEDLQGLSVFGALSFAPSSIDQVNFYGAGGLSYKGLLPTRDKDVTGVAVSYAGQSNGARIANAGVADKACEITIEATYQILIAPWWSFQPDLQYVINPGFNTTSEDALVLGARTSITF